MSDTVNDPLEPADPPDNQGGGGTPTSDCDSDSNLDGKTADPPENQGGGSYMPRRRASQSFALTTE